MLCRIAARQRPTPPQIARSAKTTDFVMSSSKSTSSDGVSIDDSAHRVVVKTLASRRKAIGDPLHVGWIDKVSGCKTQRGNAVRGV